MNVQESELVMRFGIIREWIDELRLFHLALFQLALDEASVASGSLAEKGNLTKKHWLRYTKPDPSMCSFFITRKQRYCTSQVSCPGSFTCSMHLDGKPLGATANIELATAKTDYATKALKDADWTGKTNVGRRLKHMTNPLSRQYQIAAKAPDWKCVFSGSENRELVVDVGCARGRWLQQLCLLCASAVQTEGVASASEEKAQRHQSSASKNQQQYNFLGLEIFPPIVVAANAGVAAAPSLSPLTGHLHFVQCNAVKSLESLQLHEAAKAIALLCVQFPDPWNNAKKAEKKRLLREEFARSVARTLPVGACLYIATDYPELASAMRDTTMRTQCFRPWPLDRPLPIVGTLPPARVDGGDLYPTTTTSVATTAPAAAAVHLRGNFSDPSLGSIPAWSSGPNPFGVPTERDRVCEVKRRTVWRLLLERCPGDLPPLDQQQDHLAATMVNQMGGGEEEAESSTASHDEEEGGGEEEEGREELN